MSGLRARARRTFMRSRGARELAALARWPRLRRELPDLSHLAFYDERSEGPLQRDEALFLHALLRVTRPLTVIEIGFYRGHSALNFLSALDADARLYSFDIDEGSESLARETFAHDSRFTFHRRSQDAIAPDDVGGRKADFVLIDGAHELAINQATWRRLVPLLAPDAIVAIHDTGLVPGSEFPHDHWTRTIPERWIGDACEHQPDERAFANWILAEHPEFAQIHLHTLSVVRWGLTLLQRSAPLPRPDGA